MIRIIILLFFATSCRDPKETQRASSCAKELKEAAVGNWYYKKKCNCYEGSKTFYDKFNSSKSCIMTLNAEQVKNIIGEPTGKPTMAGKTTVYRYRLAPCEKGKCVTYEFDFDSSMNVIGFTTNIETSTSVDDY